MNTVNLIGRLTKDLELRYTSNNIAFCNFTIAINRPFKNESGENEVDFINCVAWRNTAENMSKYCGKGDQIGIIGRIQTRNYENNEGKRIYITEIACDSVQFLGQKRS